MLNISIQEQIIKEQEAAVATTTSEEASNAPAARDKGIPVDFFLNTSPLLKDKHIVIQRAILQAMGIHTQNKQQVNITWIQFLKMSTLLSYHCATKQQYVEFVESEQSRRQSVQDISQNYIYDSSKLEDENNDESQGLMEREIIEMDRQLEIEGGLQLDNSQGSIKLILDDDVDMTQQ